MVVRIVPEVMLYDASNSSPLDSLNPRKIFISASGVHNHFGVSWFNPEDLATKRKAMNRGLRKILLARHALFDEVASASLAPISAFDVLISDRPLPQIMLRTARMVL